MLPTDEARLHELRRLLDDHAIVSHYQPIVDLDTGAVVAYEALARGPVDSPLHMPGDLFGTAAKHGLLRELDWACRAAALHGAIGTGLTSPTALFVNIEPVAAAAAVPAEYERTVRDAGDQLRVVFELTERALTERPGEVLRAVRHLRALGARIALDDVGVDPRSLALMPFLRPEVVKLDMSVVQGTLSSDQARTMHAVNAYAEESGALILAEGIETDEHLERALALGARYGQGWLFGRPGPAPTHRATTETMSFPRIEAPATPATGNTPYERVRAAGRRPRVASKHLLLALSRELEVEAEVLGPECVVLVSLQNAGHFTPATRARYRRLAERTAFAGVLGTGLNAAPEPGVRGGPLEPDDPLVREWTVCVVSPHFAAAMVAIDLGDDAADDLARRFDYCLTYDRATVVRAARVMMAQIAPPEDA